MQVIGELRLSRDDRILLWTIVWLFFISLITTIILNYKLRLDKNRTLYLELKAEVLRDMKMRTDHVE